jgi:hypothetical protein
VYDSVLSKLVQLGTWGHLVSPPKCICRRCSPSYRHCQREFYEETTIDNNINDNDGEHASKKIKLSNDPQTWMRRRRTSWTECWVKVGRLGFYLRHLGRMPLRNSRIIQYNNCNLIIQVRCYLSSHMMIHTIRHKFVYKFLVGHLTISGSTEEIHS